MFEIHPGIPEIKELWNRLEKGERCAGGRYQRTTGRRKKQEGPPFPCIIHSFAVDGEL